MPSLIDILSDAGTAARNLADFFSGRTLRLGVTGLAGAGKTIFMTALVQHLTLAARLAALGEKNPLPVFRVHAEGRLLGARLEPQPDDAVPPFAYEEHLDELTGRHGRSQDRAWPQSTKRISELRLVIEFEHGAALARRNPAKLAVDVVDYPGEWLLDLTLLDKSYRRWSEESLAAAEARAPLGSEWRSYIQNLNPDVPFDEAIAQRAATLFTGYLRACRAEPVAASSLPPGRFLLPGDLAGSPLLTFSPLKLDASVQPNSLGAMMARRYDAYRNYVVRPFFRDHFARLDRQIVLVDVLAALNAGPTALRDLERALGDVLNAFRAGKKSLLSSLLRPKIDKILFAATKADHLNHVSHDRLEAILRRLTARSIARAENLGAAIDVVALAAVRATREANVARGGVTLPAVVGTPLKGERIGDEIFDGQTEVAIFPGQLPDDPDAVFAGNWSVADPREAEYRFMRFRPPIAVHDASASPLPLPHIRLDRALQFLLADRLR